MSRPERDIPPGENPTESTKRWYGRIWHRLEDPAVITAAQIAVFLLTSAAGITAVAGGFPYRLTEVLGHVALLVGAVLSGGGLLGAIACYRGTWWLERVALKLVGLGWSLMVPSLLYVPLRTPLRVFFLILIALALLDAFKRYRRIDWAYLDPTK